MKIPVCICCHDDGWHLKVTIQSFLAAGPVILFVSDLAWDGSQGDPSRVIEIGNDLGAEVILGSTPTEAAQRTAALALLKSRGYRYVLIPDSDEVVSPELLHTLTKVAESGIADTVRVHMATYFKSPRYVVQPPERLAPILMLDCQAVEHRQIREYSGSKPLVLGAEYGVLHHLSYVGPNERIAKKISTWSHKNELVEGWYKNVWLGWDENRFLTGLHPTHPDCFMRTERIVTPEVLLEALDPVEVIEDPEIEFKWPTLSIVIPLYGGPEDITACLESLSRCRGGGVTFETIVVDDASRDDAPTAVEGFENVRLIRNETNQGFAESCNRGLEVSQGEIVIFLNSDTHVPRAALIRLVETMQSSGVIGAAGPYTNAAGYHQPIVPNYSTLDRLDDFARDFADRDVPDLEVSMLVGFCLAVRRSVLDEVGPFDTRFGQGLYEDTDLVHRIQRARFKTVISARSFVHHAGSKSLARMEMAPAQLLAKNKRLYEEKWSEDLTSGFASHLAGQHPDLIRFDYSREPKKLRKELLRKAKRANITLCMIVKNEERVLGECLKSMQDMVRQIVIVDTGSSDRTCEIAKSYGAEVYHMAWPDSFADARNESLKYSKGDWNIWVDADDTMPFATANEILDAILAALADLIGLRVRVQFVEGGPASGTRVDHIKVFRNVTGVRFTGHIHEQILGSLREIGGRIELIQGPVLHSGYDNSVEGQRGKRKRERKLLALDLKTDPHHPFFSFNLGMTAFYSNRFRAAKGWLKRSIRDCQGGETILRKCFVLLGMCEEQLGRPEVGLALYEKGLSEVGKDPELYFRVATALIGQGRFQDALPHLEAIGTSTDEFFASIDIGIMTFRKSALLAEVYFGLGELPRAKEQFIASIEGNPSFKPAIQRLFELSMQSSDARSARFAIASLLRLEGATEEWTHWQLALADLLEIDRAEQLNRLLGQYPGALGPRVVIAHSLLARGEHGMATPLLQELARMDHAESAFNLGIIAINHGDIPGALAATTHAAKIEPGNPKYQAQLEHLTAVHDIHELSALEGSDMKEILLGPHVGELGQSSCGCSVIVVTHNSSSTLRACGQSVLAELEPGDELIFIDNASSDDTCAQIDKLARRDGRIQLIRNLENVGYSLACNQGLKGSTGKFLVTLNPDAVLTPGTLTRLFKPLTGQVAATGPLADNVGAAQFVGHYLDGAKPTLDELPHLLAKEREGQLERVKLLMGFCLALRRDVLNEVGLLCEETELGADDLELSWRLRELGYELKIALDGFVLHECGHSFANSPTKELARVRIQKSDRALVRKLATYYGWVGIPTSLELWDSQIFDEAFARFNLSRVDLA